MMFHGCSLIVIDVHRIWERGNGASVDMPDVQSNSEEDWWRVKAPADHHSLSTVGKESKCCFSVNMVQKNVQGPSKKTAPLSTKVFRKKKT